MCVWILWSNCFFCFVEISFCDGILLDGSNMCVCMLLLILKTQGEQCIQMHFNFTCNHLKFKRYIQRVFVCVFKETDAHTLGPTYVFYNNMQSYKYAVTYWSWIFGSIKYWSNERHQRNSNTSYGKLCKKMHIYHTGFHTL